MSHQLALCARVVRTGDISVPLKFGITVDDFTAAEAKNFWTLLLNYYTQQESRGSVLGEGTLHTWFKQLKLQDDMPGSTFETLCYEVRRARIVTEANNAVVRFSEAVNIPACNPTADMAALVAKVNNLISLGTTANTDVSLRTGLDNIKRKLDLAKQGVRTAKLDWPWKPLQDATFGIQPDDYIVFYGRPKSMKTWVLCYLLSWAFENEKKLVVYTKEMTPDNVYMRTLACILRFSYEELRAASSDTERPLSPANEEQFYQLIAYIQTWGLDSLITVLSGKDVPAGGDTVAWLGSKIEQYKPDLCFIDGLYLLSDPHKEDHARVRSISRDVRQMNLATGVPVIATLQANRKAAGHSDANLDEIAYSDAIGQDATIAARVINDKTSPTISIVLAGSREFKLHGLRINAIPAKDFTFHSELTEKDIQKAKEADQTDVEKKDELRSSEGKKNKSQKTIEAGTDTDHVRAMVSVAREIAEGTLP
jgi:replicative DNA helicase